MVPEPSCPFTWDYWTTSLSKYVELTCLMPNSMYIPIRAKWDDTLQVVKQDLWFKAQDYPLFGMLHEMQKYVFQFINSLAQPEDVDDEGKLLRDIKPTCGVLIIIERSDHRPGEQILNTQIGNLIGKGLNEFESLRSSEVNDFRIRMRSVAEESFMKRQTCSELERLWYLCPPRLASPQNLKPPNRLEGCVNKVFTLITKMAISDETYTTQIPDTTTPQQHIELILKTKVDLPLLDPKRLVLKVCGREEYLLGDSPLTQFLYIQETLAKSGVPRVMIVELEKLPLSVELNRDMPKFGLPDRTRSTSEHSNTIQRRKDSVQSSWNIDRDYTCTVQSVGGLNVDPGRTGVEVICQAGIFHGGKPLCESQKTRLTAVSSEGVADFNQELRFPIKVYNVPRMGRLCFVIYEITKSKSKKKGKEKDTINKLAWANTMIFDYKDQLCTNGVTLFMWTHVADQTQGDDLLLHPLGTVVCNPNTDSCAALQVRFSDYDCPHPILFPEPETVKSFFDNSGEDIPLASIDLQQPRASLEKDTNEIHEQEKKDIWAAREYIRTTSPQYLPKIIACVEWCERAGAARVARLLPTWPVLPVESALELLDYEYADAGVRSFAVRCLREISDQDLLLYLLQLVQALKHESYLMCDLSKFLLERAFRNQTIGHYLFWHLRSEMHVPAVAIRFGLILEAYCRGSQEHIHSLATQIKCLDKLKWVSQCVRTNKEISKARAALKIHLREAHCVDTLRNFVSPLSPSFICKRIRPENCRVMDSKMRPLLLEFENLDPTGTNIRVILKIGDDLRQDMFTLQMLRIMDRLWKNAGYDFRLNAYSCISLEYAVGMIEVVEDAETVANIQKQSAFFNATSTINKTNLFHWLRKQHHKKENEFNKAIHEFTMSCAGYCVATYVLGIADRHPDNIMVKKSGQLFHIDFGHFLGHFKHKYGIRRERVPFVLTQDFINVINKTQKGTGRQEPLEFKIFKEMCEAAFKILRKHGHLILSLFSMMISTGLPELSSEKDLQYLRETLVMELSEEKAMEHFRQKFIEAYKNSWMTSFNWAFHNFDKNN